MTEEIVMNLGAEAVRTIIYVAGPLLIAAMVMGIVVSILQAITQINESTLTFIPKMVAILLVMAIMAPWMLEVLKQYTIEVIGGAGEIVR